MPFFAALVLLGAAGQAAAEPIKLTSGSIVYSRSNVAEFRAVSANGIEIIGQFGDDASESWNPDHACFDCTPGTRIKLKQSESFASDAEDSIFAGGSVRVDDVDYWFDSLRFKIKAHHINIPDTADGNALVNAGRFAFKGRIVGTSDDGVTRMFRLKGKGTVSVFFGNNDWFSTTYKFGDASVAAVPEPGTLLLFGSGGIAALVRRKRQRQDD